VKKNPMSERKNRDDSSFLRGGRGDLSILEMEEDEEMEFDLNPDEELEDLMSVATDNISLSIYSKQDT